MNEIEVMDDRPAVIFDIAISLGYNIDYTVAESIAAEFPGNTWAPIEQSEVERILKARGYAPTRSKM